MRDIRDIFLLKLLFSIKSVKYKQLYFIFSFFTQTAGNNVCLYVEVKRKTNQRKTVRWNVPCKYVHDMVYGNNERSDMA